MKQIDKKVLLGLSAPAGFVATSVILFYCFKYISLLFKLPAASSESGLVIFIITPFSAIFGSFLGLRIAKGLLAIETSLAKLIIWAVIGYAVGISLESILFIRQSPAVFKSIAYPAAFVVLLCGYMGTLIAGDLVKKKP